MAEGLGRRCTWRVVEGEEGWRFEAEGEEDEK